MEQYINAVFKKLGVNSIEEKKQLFIQFVKFGLVGASNTLISWAFYYLILWIDEDLYLIGGIIGAAIGIANAFVWNDRVVFKGNDTDWRSVLLRLGKTYVSYGGASLISILLSVVEVELFGVSKTIVPVINLIITVPLNYLVSKFWVFCKHTNSQGNELQIIKELWENSKVKCIICGSEDIQTIDTIISDFVMARIDSDFEEHHNNSPTKLCFCRTCTFAFYEYRFTSSEEKALYKNYRDEAYQKTREKYECWYTEKVNAEINKGEADRQQKCIKKMLIKNGFSDIKTALDFGGNQGSTFYHSLGSEAKYVYDISGAPPLLGIHGIRDYSELSRNHYDFIMCNMVFEHLSEPYTVLEELYNIGDNTTVYYIEVPGENPFVNGNKFSAFKNLHLVLNKKYSLVRLVKYYLKLKKQPYMPMKEHINFFTQKSLSTMIENGGFSIIAINKGKMHSTEVLSVLFKKTIEKTIK